jgi:carboxypeptidase Q
MSIVTSVQRAVALSLCFAIALPSVGAQKKTTEATQPSYELPQPQRENLDLNMYQLIRQEGITHSHVMEYASALADGIGPRLTGSPNLQRANEWTRDQLTAMGCVNAHLEDWGEFGMGWQQLNTWIRMTSPDTAVLIAQAAPWSPATNGPITAQVAVAEIKEDKDIDQYRGKLGGKIVFLGAPWEVKPVDKPLYRTLDDADLKKIQEYPLKPPSQDFRKDYMKRLELHNKINSLMAEEKALAVVVPSREMRDNGATGGTFADDSGADLTSFAYQHEHMNSVPVAVMAIENYGRVYRLVKARVPVSVEMNIDTKFTGDHEHGFNTIAEIPGTDPKLKDELVMVGGHLDSWASATGATDNGAGTVVAMEVMRILNTLGVKPRRTIRVGLWTGEEQGEFGSAGYVKQHFGYVPLSTAPDQMKMPEWLRKPAGPVELKADQKIISGYFNVDNGSGKIRGVYTQGNAAMAPIFAQWIAPLKDLGVTAITNRNTGGTDHLSFDAVGIPGFQFIQDPLDYGSRTHHTNMDTYERLQPEDLAQAATVEAIFVYNAAMRDQMLPRKPLPHPEREEQSTTPLKNVMPGAEAEEKGIAPKTDQEPKPPGQPPQQQPTTPNPQPASQQSAPQTNPQ